MMIKISYDLRLILNPCTKDKIIIHHKNLKNQCPINPINIQTKK